MKTFYYKAKKKDGTEYDGTFEAENRFEIYNHVRKEGGIVLSVKEGSSGGLFDMNRINILLSSVKQSEKIIFTRNLAAMLDAGLSLSRALAVMKRQTKNPKFKDVMDKLETTINSGGTFHAALVAFPKVFSSLLTSMVKAGEEGGTLPDALRTVSLQMERSLTLKKKIQGALIYPSIILVALVIIGILMLIFIVPTLRETFDDLGVELPTSTQLIITSSDFLVNNTLTAIALIVAIVGSFWWALGTKRGQRIFEYIILRIPIIGTLNKEINSARTARTLSSLLSSGVDIITAMDITRDVVQNSYYKEVLVEAKDRVQKGKPLHEVFDEHEELYPIFVGELVAVGEETGNLPSMLLQVAEFYEGEVEQKTKDMSTIVEPFLMIIVGAVVGFFAISMITPIYSITEGI